MPRPRTVPVEPPQRVTLRPEPSEATPRYQQVKAFILKGLRSGEFSADARIPSENELVRLCGVSRVTVNRALREMADAALLKRVQGVGTFVAEQKPESALLELRNIADEIAARGGRHEARVELLASAQADAALAVAFGLPEGTELYRCVLTHREDGVPVQREDRYVSPMIFPNFLRQDFVRSTPYRYLLSSAPLERLEHVVEAVLPDAATQRALEIGPTEPCLLLHRRTWSWGVVATRAWLTHPGSRYRLGGAFD